MEKLTSSAVIFRQSKIDGCVFYWGKIILYTDDYILAGTYAEGLMKIVADIKVAGLDITEEIDIKYFLGVNIENMYS